MRVGWYLTGGTVVVGNSTIDVSGQTKPKADGARICGAMAQQHGVSGHHETESVPQKFVHLVGYRDPNACKAPWIRPRRTAEKP